MARKPQGKLRRLYDAHETLEKSVAEFFAAWSAEDTDVSGLVWAIEVARDEVSDLAEEYRESASAFPNGGGIADALEEKADMVESWASALDDAANGIEEWREESALFDAEDVERREGESDEDYDARVEEAREEAVREAREEWREEVRRLAEDALGEYPL
jgi:hypothetical protein